MNNLFTNPCTLISSIVFCLSLTSPLESQNNALKADYYNWFDEVIGKSNTGLLKGTEYFERYRSINGRHQYFNTDDFNAGSVIFDGQHYFNIPLKYDVFEEKLLTKDPNALNAPIIVLEIDKIIEFTINNHKFINILNNENDKNTFKGFFEILYESDSLRLYKKHQKEIIRKTDEKIVSYQFKDRFLHIVNYKNFNYKLKKANDLNSIFTDFKKDIKHLSIKHKAIRKSDPDNYMLAILKELYTIINTNNSLVK